jgi:hypothetical protein
MGTNLWRNIRINANINYEGAKKYKDVYGNTGINWRF